MESNLYYGFYFLDARHVHGENRTFQAIIQASDAETQQLARGQGPHFQSACLKTRKPRLVRQSTNHFENVFVEEGSIMFTL